jgi:hypothetical protein
VASNLVVCFHVEGQEEENLSSVCRIIITTAFAIPRRLFAGALLMSPHTALWRHSSGCGTILNQRRPARHDRAGALVAVTPRSIKSPDLDYGRWFITEDLVLDLH